MKVFPITRMVKNLPVIQETQVRSPGREEDLSRREWQSTPGFLSGDSRGQRSQAGYSLWDRKESE